VILKGQKQIIKRPGGVGGSSRFEESSTFAFSLGGTFFFVSKSKFKGHTSGNLSSKKDKFGWHLSSVDALPTDCC
jgi:hypothetical protein